MEELLSIATLIAAVGALATSLVGIWVTRMHAREGETMRLASDLHTKRLEIYEKLAEKTWALFRATSAVEADVDELGPTVTVDEHNDTIEDIRTRLDVMADLHNLVGRYEPFLSDGVAKALVAFFEAGDALADAAYKKAQGKTEPWDTALSTAVDAAHNEIVEQMRIDLRLVPLTESFAKLIPHREKPPLLTAKK